MKKEISPLVLKQLDGVIAKDGLLWRGKYIVGLPEADEIANRCGFFCAERLVAYLLEDKGAPVWED